MGCSTNSDVIRIITVSEGKSLGLDQTELARLEEIKKNEKKEIGLDRLPTWTEIFITPAGFVIYFILSAVLMLVFSTMIPIIDLTQVQDVGFDQLNHRYEYLLAFSTLVILAPIAEEILFRGYLFGKLKKNVPIWLAIITTSIVFGMFHGAWNIGIDTFALSIVLCLLRQATGSLWPSILLHMLKNSIAFYILFINPVLSTMLLK
jgi:membrane protease YdiL (CAAX protease family)